jgi:hypothetical protein
MPFFRNTTQSKKFKLDRKNPVHAIIVVVVLLALMIVVPALLPSGDGPAKSQATVKPVPTTQTVEQYLNTVDSPDEIVRSAKQEQFCSLVNSGEYEQIRSQDIEKCLVTTKNWSTEDFETNIATTDATH